MKLSIIIPTLNEEESLPRLLTDVTRHGEEILIVDGGSTDSTLEIAKQFPVKGIRAERGRASQMNAGAAAATGEILWFLHADTKIPPHWREQLLGAVCDPKAVGGAFQVVIDSPAVRYRLLDLWGRFRPFLQRNFYGDQGIFVRREIFKKLGGFSEGPVLEDVDFSSRLWRQGRVVLLPGPLRTSARRWETQGWWRTVFNHTRLALTRSRIHPSTHSRIAVIILAKAPVPGQVKTRLVPPLTHSQAAALARRLLQETVTLVQGLKGVDPFVAVSPPDAIDEVHSLFEFPISMIPQTDGDLGRRLHGVFTRNFSKGFQGVIILGADHPNLPASYLTQAVEVLRRETDPVVLGPTEDGGYYLIGLKRPHPELFQDVPWSSSDVLQVTQEKAKAHGLFVTLLPPWFDIDRPEDLARFP